MTWFRLAIFIHISGVLLLFGGMAAELVSVLLLRKAEALGQVRTTAGILEKLEKVFSTAGILILLSGVYMTVLRMDDHRSIGWVIVSVLVFIAMAAFGSSVGRRVSAQLKAATHDSGDRMLDSLQMLSRSNLVQANLVFGPSAVLAVLILMIFKPSVVVSILVVAAVGIVAWLAISKLGVRTTSSAR